MRDVLDACRDQKDPKAYLMSELEIDSDDAEVLLGLTVRQLTRLHLRDLEAEMKTKKKEVKVLKKAKKNVAEVIINDLPIK